MANYSKHYDWKEIQGYYDLGHTYKQTKEHFGFAADSWRKAVSRGDLKPRRTSGNAELIPVTKLKSRSNIKKRLIGTGMLENKCAICGIEPIWQGERLPLELDHINGLNDDNRLENLRILCPNCHAIQKTSNGKNKGRRQRFQFPITFPLEFK